MEPDFWHQRWERDQIGFHEHEFNTHMMRFIRHLGVKPGDHVLVPLCGKSRDMLWLEQHDFQVTGIEISPIAVEAFFRENGREAKQTHRDGAAVYQAGSITIHCADFFAVSPQWLPPVHGVYDRASLIALPPAMRPDYVEQLMRLSGPSAGSLLITLDYPPEEMQGPPFSIDPEAVQRLFQQHYRVEQIHQEDCLAESHFRNKGLTRLLEHVFSLSRGI